jgi:hypothetical protein
MSAVALRIYYLVVRIKQAMINAVLIVKTRIDRIIEAILDSIVMWLCKRYQRPFDY